MTRTKTISRLLLGALMVAAGINHFLDTEFYVAIVPPYLPSHRALVYASGVAEIALGGLLLSRRSRAAAWGLIALFVAVFPANLHMALHPEQYPTYSEILLWLRLPLQGVLIAWAYWHTRDARPST